MDTRITRILTIKDGDRKSNSAEDSILQRNNKCPKCKVLPLEEQAKVHHKEGRELTARDPPKDRILARSSRNTVRTVIKARQAMRSHYCYHRNKKHKMTSFTKKTMKTLTISMLTISMAMTITLEVARSLTLRIYNKIK